jgi:hypothetical protein
MAFDVFISYSSKDRLMADAVVARLEQADIRCWIAPRNIEPGKRWGEAIIEALDTCRILVLIWTSQANDSKHVAKEVERAVHKGLVVIPLRAQEVQPSLNMEFFLSDTHWLDALTPPLDAHIQNLREIVSAILKAGKTDSHAADAKLSGRQQSTREEYIEAFETAAMDNWFEPVKPNRWSRLKRFLEGSSA